MQTLSFDDDLPSPTVPPLAQRTAETIRAQVTGGILARGEPVHDLDVERQATMNTSTQRVRVEDKRVINGQADVNQLVPFK